MRVCRGSRAGSVGYLCANGELLLPSRGVAGHGTSPVAAPLQIVAGVEIRERGLAIELSVRVKPRASRDRVLPPREGRLELSVTAPPEDGKANLSVCRLLA